MGTMKKITSFWLCKLREFDKPKRDRRKASVTLTH